MPARPGLPVSLYVVGRRCVVVGDGAVADERRGRLAAAGALVEQVPAGGYRADACAGSFLVVCCDAALAARVTADARAAGALAYALDDPDRSDLAMPALVRRGPLQIAISTQGTAPALARRLREELERLLATAGDDLDALVAELGRLRDELPLAERRTRLYEEACAVAIEGRLVVRRG